MGKYFGTDGFRGEANKDLTVEHAYKVGRYIGWYFGRNKDHAQVVIGKDTRCFFNACNNNTKCCLYYKNRWF